MNEPDHTDDAMCFPVWVLGLQTITRTCINNGPYGIWFASSLIITLMIYAVVRVMLANLQDVLINYRSKDFVVPYSNPNNIERANKPKNLREYVGNLVTLVCYNRYSPQSSNESPLTELMRMDVFVSKTDRHFGELWL
jgi:hypothetical protein